MEHELREERELIRQSERVRIVLRVLAELLALKGKRSHQIKQLLHSNSAMKSLTIAGIPHLTDFKKSKLLYIESE